MPPPLWSLSLSDTRKGFISWVPKALCTCLLHVHVSIILLIRLFWNDVNNVHFPSNSKFYNHRAKLSFSFMSLTDFGECHQWGSPFHSWLDFTVRKFLVRVNHTASLFNIHLPAAGSSLFYRILLIEAFQILRASVICPNNLPWPCHVVSPAISYRKFYKLPSLYFPLSQKSCSFISLFVICTLTETVGSREAGTLPWWFTFVCLMLSPECDKLCWKHMWTIV